MSEKKYIYTIEREKAKCFINPALDYDFEILDCDSVEIMRCDEESKIHELVSYYNALIVNTEVEKVEVGKEYELVTLWKVNEDDDYEELGHFVCEIGSF